jgi:hypothetical protein
VGSDTPEVLVRQMSDAEMREVFFMVDVASETPKLDALLIGLGKGPWKLRKARFRRRLQTTHVSNAPDPS